MMESMYNDDLQSDEELATQRCIVCSDLFILSRTSLVRNTCDTCQTAAIGVAGSGCEIGKEDTVPPYDLTIPPRRIRGRVALSRPFDREGVVYKLSVIILTTKHIYTCADGAWIQDHLE